MKIKLLIPLLLIVTVIISVAFTQPAKEEFSCKDSPDPGLCYGQIVSKMLTEQGVVKTLAYIDKTISPESGYGTVHTVLHLAGEYAYIQERDLSKVLGYLGPYMKISNSIEKMGAYDGFFHGAVTQFFVSNRNMESRNLINQVCEEDLALPVGMTFGPRECYHAVGHALMYVKENRLAEVLDICETQSDIEKRGGCYVGTYMEYAFLYWPSFHPESPRPLALGTSMATLCVNQSSEQRSHFCEEFIGTSYIAHNLDNIRGAYAECELASSNYLGCIDRLSKVTIPSFFSGDLDKMLTTCNFVKPSLQQRCESNIKEGLLLNANTRHLRSETPI